MNRIISALGTLLVLGGLVILAYVGVTYAQSSHKPAAIHPWSAAQRRAAQNLQSHLNRTQRVTIPRALAKRSLPIGREPGIRIVIPRINVDSPIVQTPPVAGVWIVADWAVGHLSTTPDPGAVGNGAYAAHDDIKGEIFKRENELSPGDQILIYTKHVLYHYVVVNQQTVDPSNVSVLAPTRTSTITLISCTPYWVDTERLIVSAVLKSSSPV